MQVRYRAAITAALVAVSTAALISVVPAGAVDSFTFTRLAGGDRFGTAAEIAKNSFTNAPTVLLARGDNFPDALAGGYLAGSTGSGAPILLTRTEALPQSTIDAMAQLGATRAILLGGTAAISTNVENELRARNITPERVGGATRFDTAQLIAQKPGAANVGSTDGEKTAIISSGRNFPDALAGGPAAYAGRLPSLLTEPGSLPSQTRAALTSLAIKRVWLLGGLSAVGAQVESELTAMGITVVRAAGADRQATAVLVANAVVQKLGFNTTHVGLARGDDFADALTFGPHNGEDKSALLLTGNPTTLTNATRDYLVTHSPTLQNGHIAGGLAAVSQAVQDDATTAARGTASAVTVTTTSSSVAPGGTVNGTIAGTGITGVTVSGCGLTSQAVTRDNSGNFSLVIPASQPAGACVLTFTSTLQGGGTETDTVNMTVGAATTAYNVAGSRALQDVNTARTCTATVPSGDVVAIMLVPTSAITSGTGGAPNFADANSDNVADMAATASRITSVNGTAITPAQKQNSTTSTGTITFTISSATAEEVTAVVFSNPAAGNNNLDLVVPGAANANPKAASEPVGIGCTTVFAPAAATTGASTPTVVSAFPDLDTFTSATATYKYDSNDTFQYQGVAITMEQFEGVLTTGDVLAVAYAPAASGVSTFNITTDSVLAPTGMTAGPAANLDSGTTANDVKVEFTAPTGNGSGTTYKVQRAPVTVLGADAACGGAGPNADTPALAAAYVDVPGTVTFTTTSGVTKGTVTDFNVANGCYDYRVVASNGATSQSGIATVNSVAVPGALDAAAPTITDVRANDTGAVGTADATDVHRFIFSEPMQAIPAGANYQVSDTDNTTANITCGSGGTTCSLNAATVTISGTPYVAGRVLTVTLGTVNGTGGNTNLQYNTLTIGAISNTIKDVAGNPVTLAGSDVLIQADPAFPPAI